MGAVGINRSCLIASGCNKKAYSPAIARKIEQSAVGDVQKGREGFMGAMSWLYQAMGGWASVGVLVISGEPLGAIAAPPSVFFAPIRPQDSPVLMSQRLDCRQVAPERGAAFYSTLPQQRRAPNDVLPRGSRVSLDVTANAILAPDGQFYHFVTYPFGSPNTVTGYIPVQTQTQAGFRTTLEPCRRRMW